jgi:hypothetical protein
MCEKTKTTLILCHNKILLSFLNDTKKIDPSISKKISKHKVFKRTSDEYIIAMKLNSFHEIILNCDNHNDLLNKLKDADFTLYHDLKLKHILNCIDDKLDMHKDITKYIYIFTIMSYLYDLTNEEIVNKTETTETTETTEEPKNDIDVLFEKILGVLDEASKATVTEVTENIMDDVLVNLIHKVVGINIQIEHERVTQEMKDKQAKRETSPEDPNDPLHAIRKTKIGQLAEEISKDIHKDLKIDNPEDLLDFKKLMDGNNDTLGNMFKAVGSKVAEKFGNGEIDQGELLKDLMGLAGNLGGMGGGAGGAGAAASMGMLGEIMKNMSNMGGAGAGAGGGGGQQRSSRATARKAARGGSSVINPNLQRTVKTEKRKEELRQKLQKRKGNDLFQTKDVKQLEPVSTNVEECD